MNSMKKVIGVYLIVYSIILAILFTTYLLLDNFINTYDAWWYVLNWFTALGVVFIASAAVCSKRSIVGKLNSVSPVRYIRVNTLFYSALLLVMWYFWIWFRTALGYEDVDMWWGFVDPLFVLLGLSVGTTLLSKKAETS